ncbi:MAG: hypothetical protein ACRDQ0_15150, partial [Pseudonocardia sp.]
MGARGDRADSSDLQAKRQRDAAHSSAYDWATRSGEYTPRQAEQIADQYAKGLFAERLEPAETQAVDGATTTIQTSKSDGAHGPRGVAITTITDGVKEVEVCDAFGGGCAIADQTEGGARVEARLDENGNPDISANRGDVQAEGTLGVGVSENAGTGEQGVAYAGDGHAGNGNTEADTTDGGVARVAPDGTVTATGNGTGTLRDANGSVTRIGAAAPGGEHKPNGGATLVDRPGDAPSTVDFTDDTDWRTESRRNNGKLDILSGHGDPGKPIQLNGPNGDPVVTSGCKGCDYISAEGILANSVGGETLDVVGPGPDGLGGSVRFYGVVDNTNPGDDRVDDDRNGPWANPAVLRTPDGVVINPSGRGNIDSIVHTPGTKPGEGGSTRIITHGEAGQASGVEVLGALAGPSGALDQVEATIRDAGGYDFTIRHRNADGSGGGILGRTFGDGRIGNTDAFGEWNAVWGDGGRVGLLFGEEGGYKTGGFCIAGAGGGCAGSPKGRELGAPAGDGLGFPEGKGLRP